MGTRVVCSTATTIAATSAAFPTRRKTIPSLRARELMRVTNHSSCLKMRAVSPVPKRVKGIASRTVRRSPATSSSSTGVCPLSLSIRLTPCSTLPVRRSISRKL
uniref:Uncharacterized protein n=1 Tax=Cacopsylla melanoneura TaxID=428564 RepID=A0A8D8XTY6_9HEMI